MLVPPSFFRMRNASLPFLRSIAVFLSSMVYPPEELIPGNYFHMVMRGVAIKDNKVHISGSWWGEDMIVTDLRLRRTEPGRAMTFIEVTSLSPGDLSTVLEQYPAEAKRIR